MIPEAGHFALILALLVADPAVRLGLGSEPLIGVRPQGTVLMRLASHHRVTMRVVRRVRRGTAGHRRVQPD